MYLIPKISASSVEYANVNISYALFPLRTIKLR